jgi:hypothetical protein
MLPLPIKPTACPDELSLPLPSFLLASGHENSLSQFPMPSCYTQPACHVQCGLTEDGVWKAGTYIHDPIDAPAENQHIVRLAGILSHVGLQAWQFLVQLTVHEGQFTIE